MLKAAIQKIPKTGGKTYTTAHRTGIELLIRLLRKNGIIKQDESPKLKTGFNGRPYIEGLNIDFNISHSGEYAFAAVSDRPVGADIQKIGTIRPAVLKRFFTDGERRIIKEADNPGACFYRLWTFKEACIKHSGEGIAALLREDDIIKKALESGLFLTDIDIIEGYRAAICSEYRQADSIEVF